MNSNNEPLNNAILKILSLFDSDTQQEERLQGVDESEWLWQACRQVAVASNIIVLKPIKFNKNVPVAQAINSIAQSSSFRTRKVALTLNWWKWDNGPLLVFNEIEGKPYALIRGKEDSYQLFDPSTGLSQILTEISADKLAKDAYSFYRPFADTELRFRQLLKFLFYKRINRDILRLLSLEILASLAGLLVPIATGAVLSSAIPNANFSLLVQWVLGLGTLIVAMLIFRLVQGFALMRIRFKLNIVMQAAIWDRLLRLPVRFFREFNIGDLATRAAGIDTIQQEVTGAVFSTALDGLFSLFTLGLMCYYNAKLALGVAFFAIILIVAIIGVAYIQLKYQRQIAQLQGKLTSLQLQFFNHISKLRNSGSESRAFALLVKQFASKNRAVFKAAANSIQLKIFQGMLSILAIVWLFANMASNPAISFGTFLAFNAAFGQFFAAITNLANILSNLMGLIPLYERITPILTAIPELEHAGINPGNLTGHIELKNIAFQYQPDSPFIFTDLNITILPGEFVAFVGSSGCGKSTLIRLLLGSEIPNRGSILYNGYDLARLNCQIFRQQIGVVLQHSVLFAATIAENIMGVANQLDLDAAWGAAEKAGLQEEIQRMPMQMHTFIGEGGKNLSAGQRQRLMIARALVREPHILLLDEATSALDNLTQTKIMRNIQQLEITRILIAHRLSTLLHADRIYVMDAGNIVQVGTYGELVAQGGLFADLINHQII